MHSPAAPTRRPIYRYCYDKLPFPGEVWADTNTKSIESGKL